MSGFSKVPLPAVLRKFLHVGIRDVGGNLMLNGRESHRLLVPIVIQPIRSKSKSEIYNRVLYITLITICEVEIHYFNNRYFMAS